MRPAAFVILLIGPFSVDARAVEVFPDRASAVRWMATRSVERLYTTPGLKDETIRIDWDRQSESSAAARLIADELTRLGYTPHLTLPVRGETSVELFVSVRRTGCECELTLHWRRPVGVPLIVRYAERDWLVSDSVPSNVLRATSPGFHTSREAARRAAIVAAEDALVDRASGQVGMEWTRSLAGIDPKTAIRAELKKEAAPYRITETFYQQSTVAGRPLFKAFLLIELAPEAELRLTSAAEAVLDATFRGRVTRVLISVTVLLLAIMGYVWSDGRTRGFLRGPLRVAFSVVSLGLVLAVWMV